MNRDRTVLLALTGAIFTGLLIYSQLQAFSWDEGFHVLAARLILDGKRPYLDFCFPQTSLNAYVQAIWMRIFGEHWRALHALASIWTAGAIFLVADLVYRRIPNAEWKLASAIFAAVLSVSIYSLVAFGTIAQSYAICLVSSTLAMRFALDHDKKAMIFASGLAAGISASSSLLTAAVAPVLFIWLMVSKAKRAWIFPIAFAIPFVPEFWLAYIDPHVVWFNLIQYQTTFRSVNWGTTTSQDLGVFFAAFLSPAPLALWTLSVIAFTFARTREVKLSLVIGVAISAELAIAHPTFERYFLLAVPFFAIPAAFGFAWIGERICTAGLTRARLTAAICTILLIGLAAQLYGERDSLTWRQMQKVADQIDKVTPPNATLYADELIYFLTHRLVPDGMEFAYAHKIELPAERSKSLHIVSQAKLDTMIRAKAFATLETCDSDLIDRLNPTAFYANHAEVGDCQVFWGDKK